MNKKEIKNYLKNTNIKHEGIINETINLGKIFTNPNYEKKYRYLTDEQLKICIDFYSYINYVTNEELCLAFSDSEKFICQEGFGNDDNSWNAEPDTTTKLYKELLLFVTNNNYKTKEVTCGMTFFIGCMIEGIN